MDFLDARSVNRWARRVVGVTLVALVGLAGYNLANQEASPTASTVLGAQLTTTLPLGAGGDTDAAGVLADFLAGLNQDDSTATRTTVVDSTTSSTPRPPPSSTTSSTTGSSTTTVGSSSTASTTTSSLPTTTTTRPATTTTRPPITTTTTTTTTLPPTTTTTTLPPTTTTTTLPGPVEMYISSLVPGGLLGDPLWEPSVQVRVDLTATGTRRDIQVTGQWSGAYSATVSGLTAPNGRVTFWAPPIADDSLVFSVTTISHADYIRNPALDVVTQVTVTRADAF